MKNLYLTLILILISSIMVIGQDRHVTLTKDEIFIPFNYSSVIKTEINGSKINNFKILYYSKITEVIDYNKAFDDVFLDNISAKAIAFKFGEVECCGATTISLINKSNLGYDLSFKYKLVHKNSTLNTMGESGSKKLTSFTFEGIQPSVEAIILYDFKALK